MNVNVRQSLKSYQFEVGFEYYYYHYFAKRRKILQLVHKAHSTVYSVKQPSIKRTLTVHNCVLIILLFLLPGYPCFV